MPVNLAQSDFVGTKNRLESTSEGGSKKKICGHHIWKLPKALSVPGLSYLFQEVQVRRPPLPPAAAAAALRPGDVDGELRGFAAAAAVRLVPLRVVQRPVGRGDDRRLVDAALGQQAQAARVVPHLGRDLERGLDLIDLLHIGGKRRI